MPTKRSAVRSRSLALRLTPKLRAVLSRIVARAKRSIVADVKDGTVPRSVRTIGGLGSYVDQNMYFLDANGDIDPDLDALSPVSAGRQPLYDFMGKAHDRVEAWMKSGALKRIPVARKPSRKVANPSREDPYSDGITVGYGNAREFADAIDDGIYVLGDDEARAEYIRESAENLSWESDESRRYSDHGRHFTEKPRPASDMTMFEKGVRVGIEKFIREDAERPHRNPSRRKAAAKRRR